MNAEDREFIVRPDALAALGRNREPQVPVEQIPTHRSVEPASNVSVANGRRPAGSLGLISENELRQLVTAHFEYPALRRGAQGCSLELAAAFNPYSAKGRALRYLAARIMLEAFTDDGLCFSVAGAHRGCGATYVAANIGVVFSELGLRTLVVDANLKRPRMQKVFNKPQGAGLAALLAGQASPGSCIIPMSQFRDLALLPAGRGCGRMLPELGNGVLADMLAAFRGAYDVVICDSPALDGKGDDGCGVVAGMCGSTVTVFRKDRTDVARARELLASLDAVGTKQIGSVLCEY